MSSFFTRLQFQFRTFRDSQGEKFRATANRYTSRSQCLCKRFQVHGCLFNFQRSSGMQGPFRFTGAPVSIASVMSHVLISFEGMRLVSLPRSRGSVLTNGEPGG